MRNIYQYSAIILISVILGSSLYVLNNNVVALEDEDKRGYYVTLELYQYREGELIDKRVVDDDYILRNMVYMWLYALSGDRYVDVYNTYKMVDIDNVERQFDYSKIYFSRAEDRVRLGIGTNPVVVTNYALQTEVLNQKVDDGTIWVVGNQFNVTADSTIVSDGSYSISECGLSIHLYCSGGLYSVLMCRDVFSPISVNNADVIVVRYIFRFNLGV